MPNVWEPYEPDSEGDRPENWEHPGYDPDADCNCEECCNDRARAADDDYSDDGGEQTLDDIGASDVKLPALLLERLEDRPARMISFEQEIGGDSSAVALRLYEAGLTAEPRVWGYHAGNSEWLHVEDDGSVDGEIIYSRLRLDKPVIARKTETALDVVGETITGKIAKLDARCGFHVHVGIGYDSVSGARCYSMQAVQSLYHLWNHVEDTVYRLASANWTKHRTERGNDYSPATRKGLVGPMAVGNRLHRDRASLNFSPFLESRGRCTCGAFLYGCWEECTCEHTDKPTVEFRVFNATANKRKVRAYTALSLALVAYAEQNTITAQSHPVHEWEPESAPYLVEEKAEAALRLILRDLPLTDNEREDIRYCAETSRMGNEGSLLPIVKTIRRRKKPATAALVGAV